MDCMKNFHFILKINHRPTHFLDLFLKPNRNGIHLHRDRILLVLYAYRSVAFSAIEKGPHGNSFYDFHSNSEKNYIPYPICIQFIKSTFLCFVIFYPNVLTFISTKKKLTNFNTFPYSIFHFNCYTTICPNKII